MLSLMAIGVVESGVPSRLTMRRRSLSVRPFLGVGALGVEGVLAAAGAGCGGDVGAFFLAFLATWAQLGAAGVGTTGGGGGGWGRGVAAAAAVAFLLAARSARRFFFIFFFIFYYFIHIAGKPMAYGISKEIPAAGKNKTKNKRNPPRDRVPTTKPHSSRAPQYRNQPNKGKYTLRNTSSHHRNRALMSLPSAI